LVFALITLGVIGERSSLDKKGLEITISKMSFVVYYLLYPQYGGGISQNLRHNLNSKSITSL